MMGLLQHLLNACNSIGESIRGLVQLLGLLGVQCHYVGAREGMLLPPSLVGRNLTNQPERPLHRLCGFVENVEVAYRHRGSGEVGARLIHLIVVLNAAATRIVLAVPLENIQMVAQCSDVRERETPCPKAPFTLLGFTVVPSKPSRNSHSCDANHNGRPELALCHSVRCLLSGLDDDGSFHEFLRAWGQA